LDKSKQMLTRCMGFVWFIGMLKKFAKTLQTHGDGILAYYDYRISTGPLEAPTTKSKP